MTLGICCLVVHFSLVPCSRSCRVDPPAPQASSLYLGKKYEESLQQFSNAILLAPDGWAEKPKLFCNRAAALIMLHRYEEAVRDCEQAVKGDPSLLKAYTRCGRAQLHMGELERAYACFDEVKRRAGDLLRAKFGANPPGPGQRGHSGACVPAWFSCVPAWVCVGVL